MAEETEDRTGRLAMTYVPKRSVAFGPPLRAHVPSVAYLVLALGFAGVVVAGSMAPTGSPLFRYVIEADAHRLLGSRILAAIVVLSAIAAVARARMRGVVVHPEGIETRDVAGLGWPRVRHYAWPQIDCIVLDAQPGPALDLWDGRREWLPAVWARAELAGLLERIGAARSIPVKGGKRWSQRPAGTGQGS